MCSPRATESQAIISLSETVQNRLETPYQEFLILQIGQSLQIFEIIILSMYKNVKFDFYLGRNESGAFLYYNGRKEAGTTQVAVNKRQYRKWGKLRLMQLQLLKHIFSGLYVAALVNAAIAKRLIGRVMCLQPFPIHPPLFLHPKTNSTMD